MQILTQQPTAKAQWCRASASAHASTDYIGNEVIATTRCKSVCVSYLPTKVGVVARRTTHDARGLDALVGNPLLMTTKEISIELKKLDRELGLFNDNVKSKLAAYQRSHMAEIRDRLMKLSIEADKISLE